LALVNGVELPEPSPRDAIAASLDHQPRRYDLPITGGPSRPRAETNLTHGLADDHSRGDGSDRAGSWDTAVTTTETDTAGEPVTTLRGAGVAVDGRRIGRVVVALCLVALAVLVTLLYVAGAQKNSQITRLRQQGVAVTVTVTRCLGLMGGSGSNLAGYSCRGTFTVDGRRYNEVIPGNTFHAPGATLQAVTVPGDPALLSTPGTLENERASWRVFILPTSLLVILVILAGALVLRRTTGGDYRLRDAAGGV
jgi:hypothetical protein